MITIAINKICRHKYFNKFYMTDAEKIYQYLDQGTMSFKSWFKYLSIYIYINQQSHFTLLDLNKRMIDFDLAGEEKMFKKQKVRNLVMKEYDALYNKTPKGFVDDNGLDQAPALLIPRNASNMNMEFEMREMKNQLSFMENHPIKERDEEKEDFNNSLYLNLQRNLKENTNSLDCKCFLL